ncbi:MAG: voltage-gated sodium channel [Pseudoalteromonas tetraodonis]|jgi:voltage-gated sodium channel
MSRGDLEALARGPGISKWRIRLGVWVESRRVQSLIVGIIVLNAAVLGLETSPTVMERWGVTLKVLDILCLTVFVVELAIKLAVYRRKFWFNGWNIFDFVIVAVALAPGTGSWAVLRSLRIFRVLRLLSAVPQLRRVVTAFILSIPGLSGVILVMAIFFYTMGVLATNLFGSAFPQWFGTLGASLYSLFQIMTLESWSMGIVRPVMEVYPWAWAFFVPFIMIATFTILNLFIGIIVSTMQELARTPESTFPDTHGLSEALERMEKDLAVLRSHLDR